MKMNQCDRGNQMPSEFYQIERVVGKYKITVIRCG